MGRTLSSARALTPENNQITIVEERRFERRVKITLKGKALAYADARNGIAFRLKSDA